MPRMPACLDSASHGSPAWTEAFGPSLADPPVCLGLRV